MKSRNFLFTSESVTEGHPDKVCDQISDAILDEFLTKYPQSRVAAETSVTTGMVLVSGEITSDCYVDIPSVVRNTIKDIGYVGESSGGFDANTCAVLTSIDEQSTDIAGGVNKALESRSNNADTSVSETESIGAGDQGIMFGYACNETPELMPLPISLAHKLSYRLAQVRKEGLLSYLRPDGKSQVTVEYVDGKPSRIHTVLISTQHDDVIDGISDNAQIQAKIREDIKKYVIDYVFENETIKLDDETKILVNPSGRFVVGGPQGDAGLTGRKIIVDTYGSKRYSQANQLSIAWNEAYTSKLELDQLVTISNTLNALKSDSSSIDSLDKTPSLYLETASIKTIAGSSPPVKT